MADYTAYMVTDMLKDVVTEGTGRAANIPGLPIAGKTGTTNVTNNLVQTTHGLLVIRQIIQSVFGPDIQKMIVLSRIRRIPQALFKNTMAEISKDIETQDFVKPNSVVELKIEKGSNPPALPSEFTP